MKLVATLALALVSCQPAAAAFLDCYSAQVYNKTNVDLLVTWNALPCSQGTDDWRFVRSCKAHVIKAGKDYKYTYRWGTTIPHVYIFGKGAAIAPHKKDLRDVETFAGFYIHKGHFRNEDSFSGGGESAPHCKIHYHITYSQSDLERDWQEALDEHAKAQDK